MKDVQYKVLQCICKHSIGLIIRYITSLTQYLTYSTSLPQDTFDYENSLIQWFHLQAVRKAKDKETSPSES